MSYDLCVACNGQPVLEPGETCPECLRSEVARLTRERNEATGALAASREEARDAFDKERAQHVTDIACAERRLLKVEALRDAAREEARRLERERDEARADWARLSSAASVSQRGCACGKYPDLGDGVGMRDGHGDHVAHTRPGYGVTCETVVYRFGLSAAEARAERLVEALREWIEAEDAYDGAALAPCEVFDAADKRMLRARAAARRALANDGKGEG